MPVFIRRDAKKPVYSYDFRLGGRRFSGRTGATSRRDAEAIERRIREEARLAAAAERALDGPDLTLEQACARYWREVGQHRRDAKTRLACLDWLIGHFGAARPIASIGDAEVAAMVAKRRGERAWGRKDKGLVSPATVNRTATEPLRDVLTRAARLWGARTAQPDWRRHMLAEPQERVREASREEEARILAATAEGYRDVLEAAFLSGCRTCELVGRGASLGWALRWENVDFINRRFRVTGKGGRARFIPMSEALFALFRRLLGSHPEFVFTYPAARTRLIRRRGAGGEMVEERIERGRRYPVTEAGLRRAARAAFAAAGVTDFRRHDTRHTAASRITRAAGIRAAQKLLGHADIKTTVKYAHVQDSDLRHAMDAADAATENATADELREAIALIRQRKSG